MTNILLVSDFAKSDMSHKCTESNYKLINNQPLDLCMITRASDDPVCAWGAVEFALVTKTEKRWLVSNNISFQTVLF